MGGTTQASTGSHITYGASRRTMAIGGSIKGTPSARFFDHPSMISARLLYMRVAMNSTACTRKMSRPARA